MTAEFHEARWCVRSYHASRNVRRKGTTRRAFSRSEPGHGHTVPKIKKIPGRFPAFKLHATLIADANGIIEKSDHVRAATLDSQIRSGPVPKQVGRRLNLSTYSRAAEQIGSFGASNLKPSSGCSCRTAGCFGFFGAADATRIFQCPVTSRDGVEATQTLWATLSLCSR